jgi:hypothetical protein
MKRFSILLFSAIFFLVLASCSSAAPLAGAGSPTPDQGPKVSFSAPIPGATVPLGPVQLLLLSEDPLGTAQAEVLVNGESAAMIQSPDSSRAAVVLEYSWQPAAPGKYVLQAHSQNTAGTWGAFVSLELTAAEGGTVEPMESSTPTEAPTEIVATPTKTETPLMPTPLPPTATNSGITLQGTLSYLQMYPADAPCGTTTNIATATVSPADSVYSVLLFFRIGNKAGTEWNSWTKGLALAPNGPGKFYIFFTTRHIANPVPWIRAQVNYQFVGIDKQGKRLLSTTVYTNLSIINCP